MSYVQQTWPFNETLSIASVRYLLMQVSLIAQDLWTFVNFLIMENKYKQPREKFKGNYSVFSIVKARTRKLNFSI